MSKHNVVELAGREKIRDELTDLIREGACKLIAQGLELEVSELLSALSGRQDEAGRAAVVRNGYQPERDIQTGIGPVTVKVPKIRSRDGKPVSFHSALVPPYVRKSASLEAALPWLYLKGISTGEMQPALEVLLGSQAKGLSASTVSRLRYGGPSTRPGSIVVWTMIAGYISGRMASTAACERNGSGCVRW